MVPPVMMPVFRFSVGGSAAAGVPGAEEGDGCDPGGEHQRGADGRAGVVRRPGRPDPRRGPVRGEHRLGGQPVGHRAGPPERAAERGGGQQPRAGRIRLTGDSGALKELADALDDALDRLAAGYEGQRRFAANASHELRTPLAVQRVLTEVAMENPEAGEDLQRLGAQLLRTNERNERLIEGLLVLAEGDRGLPGKIPVRLDELTAKVLEAHTGMAGEHEVELRPALRPRVVPGDPLLLERLITNLVANAIAYNEPGGWVEVSVGEQPALTVANTGEHIPAEAVGTLFEPFRRLGADRVGHAGGAGLGLSIVRSVVTAHSGTIRAEARPEGGLAISIDLPAKV